MTRTRTEASAVDQGRTPSRRCTRYAVDVVTATFPSPLAPTSAEVVAVGRDSRWIMSPATKEVV